MRSTELDYDLPPELIAQRPTERRDASRLLVFERRTGAVRHRSFAELRAELDGYLTVVNDTRVVPARLHLRRASGGHVEVLLLELLEPGLWEALARPSRRLRAGEEQEGQQRHLARLRSVGTVHRRRQLPQESSRPSRGPAAPCQGIAPG